MKRSLFAFAIICFCSHFCAAQTDSIKSESKWIAPWFVEKFRVAAGIFIPINNTQVQVGLTNGDPGTEIDFENDLGFKKSTGTFLMDLQYRLTRRSRFDLSYYGINRNSSHTIQKDIEFGGDTYPVNTAVDAFFKTNIYRLSYGYSIIAKPRYEIGLLLGAHIVRFKVGLKAEGTNTSIDLNDEFGFTAPLPDVGIWGGYAFSDRWAINGEFSYLSLKIDNVKGGILGSSVSVSYRALPQLSIALGYTGFNFDLDVVRPKLTGSFEWGYGGPSLTASFSFGKKYWVH